MLHELHSKHVSLLPLAQAVPPAELLVFEGGTLAAPAPPQRLVKAIAAAREARVAFAARVLPPLHADGHLIVRSVLPIAHPILRALSYMEARHAEVGQDAPAFETALSEGRLGTFGRYPLADFQAGFLSGARPEGLREPAERLAARLAASGARFCLADLPETVSAACAAEFTSAGVTGPPPMPAATMELQARLEAARARLGLEVFTRLTRKNRDDLHLFDAVVALVLADHEAQPEGLRRTLAEMARAAAALMGQMRKESSGWRGAATTASEKVLDADTSSAMVEGTEAEAAPTSLHMPDPVLGWRLTPGCVTTMTDWGADFELRIDDDGCRVVPGQPTDAPETLALYGCSCVFGWWLPAEATMAGLLQFRLGTRWRVENHGVNGYGQTQALLQLMRDLRFNRMRAVCFAWIDAHLVRNVVAIGQIQRQARQPARRKGAPITYMPRAVLTQMDQFEVRQVRIDRPDLVGLDLSDFEPDPLYLDLVCAALLRRAATLVRAQGGHFFVLVQIGRLSAHLQRLLEMDEIPVVDAAVDGADWMIGTGNPHPNAAANRAYADVVEAHLRMLDRTGRVAAP